MKDQMLRMQLLLEPEQRQRLEKIAQRDQRTISDTTRRAIELGLRALESGQDLQARRLKTLDQLELYREEISRQHGTYLGDLLARERDARQEERDQTWRME